MRAGDLSLGKESEGMCATSSEWPVCRVAVNLLRIRV